MKNIKICKQCIYDETLPQIQFDNLGICNFCNQIKSLKTQFGTGSSKGMKSFNTIIKNIKKTGKNKKYDCVIGVSGGTDSSFLLHKAREWGLKPLAVHYDNTWNTAISTQNIHKILSKNNIDLYTHVVNNKEADDIFKSFFLAGVPELEASTDLGIAETYYRACSKFGIKYILDGHSFTTEGITPLSKNYFDGKYIKSIHDKFGQLPMKTYPLMTFNRFLWWTCFAKIKRVFPFWYIKYDKEDAQEILKKIYNWEYYGGHHLENRMTAYFHSIYIPSKFNLDFRNNTLSALVRNGKLSQKEALKRYKSPPHIEYDLENYFKKRLGFSDKEYYQNITTNKKSWRDFPTYKKRFEKLRFLFYFLVKKNLVPMSFYLKYCFEIKED